MVFFLRPVVIEDYIEADTPAAKLLKEELNVEELLLVCDTPSRAYFEDTKLMLDINEHRYNTLMLEECPLRQDIEDIIKKFAPNADPPHLFYQEKYLASGRDINLYHISGQLDSVMGLNVQWQPRGWDFKKML